MVEKDVYLVPLVVMSNYTLEYLTRIKDFISKLDTRVASVVLLINDCDEDTRVFLERLYNISTRYTNYNPIDLIELSIIVASIRRYSKKINAYRSRDIGEREYDEYVALMSEIHDYIRRLCSKCEIIGMNPSSVIDCPAMIDRGLVLEGSIILSRFIGINGNSEVRLASELDASCSMRFQQIVGETWKSYTERRGINKVYVTAPAVISRSTLAPIPSDHIISL